MSEAKEVYKHYDTDDSCITLHDCYANHISSRDATISFYFENGFWVTFDHKYNTLNETVRTDSSKVDFCFKPGDEEDVLLYVFQKSAFHKTIREEWPLQKLIDLVNDKSIRLEFLYMYKGYDEMVFECWLHFDKKPYHYECQLKIPTSKVIYCWNDLCADKKW